MTMEGVEVAELGRKTQKSPRAGMLSHLNSAYIPDGTFQDVGRDIRYEVHNYHSAGERRLARREEPSTSSNKLELPSQLYSRLLMQEGRGYPLLDAGLPNELSEPYQLHGVMVGDVGIVTQDGNFDVLFNICEPADGIINRNCVPEGFERLERPPDDGHNYRRGIAYKPGAWAISDNVQVTSCPLMNGDPTGTYTFKCSSAEGAILALPRGAEKEDLVNHGTFLKYAAAHGISWYEFVNGRLGRTVPNGSIYLITGYDKTSAWGSASCPSSSMSLEFEMRFTCTRWEQPVLRRVIHKEVENSQSQSLLPKNQCTFLRGYKVTLSNKILARIRGISIVETCPMDRIEEHNQRKVLNLSGPGDVLGFVFRDILRGGSSSAAICDAGESDNPESYHPILTSTVHPLSLDIHPSNLINQYLLSKFPGSDLAVTHDSVWCSYLEMQKQQGCQNSLLEYINCKYTPIQKQGIVSLVDAPERMNEPATDVVMHDPVSTVAVAPNHGNYGSKQVSTFQRVPINEIKSDVDMSDSDREGGNSTPESPTSTVLKQVSIPVNTMVKEEKPDIDTLCFEPLESKQVLASPKALKTKTEVGLDMPGPDVKGSSIDLKETASCSYCKAALGAQPLSQIVEYDHNQESDQDKLAGKSQIQVFNCKWAGCGLHICQSACENEKIYLAAVDQHINYHMHMAMPLSSSLSAMSRYFSQGEQRLDYPTQTLAHYHLGYGEKPYEDESSQSQPPTQQRHVSGRPQPKWAPDCPFSVQESFSIPGVLFASQYICNWGNCGISIDRGYFNDCTAYQQEVYNHIKGHVGVHAPHAQVSCLWNGCKTSLPGFVSADRNRIRHFTTHLPWYYLCPMCARFSARPDAQKGTPCLTGKCRAKDDRIASRLAEARKEYGDPAHRFTMEGFCSIVLDGINII